MNLKLRLSLYSVAIFSVVIFVASAAIYISFYKKMEQNELLSLKNKTLLAAIYYLEADEVGHVERETIKDQLRKSISRKNIAVFNEENILAKGEMVLENNIISEDFLNKTRLHLENNLITDDYFYNSLFYKDNEGDFVVITREIKTDFNQQLFTLLQILIIVFVVGVLLIYLFSRFLGKFAFQPLTNIINQIKERDNNNFTQPLSSNDTYTEIQDLVVSYNHFIDRMAQTFTIQKNFIDYVSHELRTPITALLGTLEVTNHKKRTLEEYANVMVQLKQYINDLQETLDQMMLLSGAKTSFEFQPVRIDEVVWHVIENAILYHKARINVDLQVKNNQLLTIQGNEKLLEVALNNLLGNAIKYSNNQPVLIQFLEIGNRLQIHISDVGIGILETDLKQIKQNFFRGKNTQEFQGKGIGLSMAHIIFTIHQIDLEIVPNNPKGTVVQLVF